jgi:hypothetical protein
MTIPDKAVEAGLAAWFEGEESTALTAEVRAGWVKQIRAAITAALEVMATEPPVAWRVRSAHPASEWVAKTDRNAIAKIAKRMGYAIIEPLYTHPAPAEWMPIESADEEAEEYILATSNGKTVWMVTWDADDQRWVTFNHYMEKEPWYFGWQPTHWRPITPLPAPPKKEASE